VTLNTYLSKYREKYGNKILYISMFPLVWISIAGTCSLVFTVLIKLFGTGGRQESECAGGLQYDVK